MKNIKKLSLSTLFAIETTALSIAGLLYAGCSHPKIEVASSGKEYIIYKIEEREAYFKIIGKKGEYITGGCLCSTEACDIPAFTLPTKDPLSYVQRTYGELSQEENKFYEDLKKTFVEACGKELESPIEIIVKGLKSEELLRLKEPETKQETKNEN